VGRLRLTAGNPHLPAIIVQWQNSLDRGTKRVVGLEPRPDGSTVLVVSGDTPYHLEVIGEPSLGEVIDTLDASSSLLARSDEGSEGVVVGYAAEHFDSLSDRPCLCFFATTRS
jgi:hypothetical protein